MADRDRLLELLRERSFRRGTFTLTSGRQSDFFIDCKPTVLSAEGHVLVGRCLLAQALAFEPRPVAVAGVVLGGCPLASAVAYASHLAGGSALDALLVRKESKGHGSKNRVEGAAHLSEGAPIVVVEDTVTTGGSTVRAAAALREMGLTIAGVLAIVDRCEGAAEAFAEAKLPFASLFTRADFMGDEG